MRGAGGVAGDGRVQGAHEAVGFPEEADVSWDRPDQRGAEWRRGVGSGLRARDIIVKEGPVATEAEQPTVGRRRGLARRVRRRWVLDHKYLLHKATVANSTEHGGAANGCCNLCHCVGERRLHLREIRRTERGPNDCNLVANLRQRSGEARACIRTACAALVNVGNLREPAAKARNVCGCRERDEGTGHDALHHRVHRIAQGSPWHGRVRGDGRGKSRDKERCYPVRVGRRRRRGRWRPRHEDAHVRVDPLVCDRVRRCAPLVAGVRLVVVPREVVVGHKARVAHAV